MTPEHSSARARGDIQTGSTGDKTPGFDPATAPMETDSEAGGTAMPAVPAREPVRVTPEHTNSTGYGSAMRPPDGEHSRPWGPYYLLFAVVFVSAAALWFQLA